MSNDIQKSVMGHNTKLEEKSPFSIGEKLSMDIAIDGSLTTSTLIDLIYQLEHLGLSFDGLLMHPETWKEVETKTIAFQESTERFCGGCQIYLSEDIKKGKVARINKL